MTDARSINDVVYAGREALVRLQASLLDPNTATAKGALASASDALGALERSLKLAEYEGKRQKEIAQRRAERAQIDASLKASEEAARADRRHAATLVSAGERIGAENAAKAHFAGKTKGSK